MLIPSLKFRRNYNVDKDALAELFEQVRVRRVGVK
jgi:hypothetical protein